MQLFHRPFCPHSRFVRLVLAEYGLEPELIEERPWERREDFLRLNPAGSTPVLVTDAGLPVPGAMTIAEFVTETLANQPGLRPLMPQKVEQRMEVRRLCEWFNAKFFDEVSGPLVLEMIDKRTMPVDQGGGSPNAGAMRAARANAHYHLNYTGWLTAHRNWFVGEGLSLADLAAAAHISVVDYLGAMPWDKDENARAWYARLKSRPSFRSLLSEHVAGIPPSPIYADLDF